VLLPQYRHIRIVVYDTEFCNKIVMNLIFFMVSLAFAKAKEASQELIRTLRT
jgi:hypothetical protein